MKSGLQQQAIQTLQSAVTAVKTAYVNLNDGDFYVDENGNLIDGDAILAITSNYLKEKGQLKGDTVVATVMSNLGLRKYAQDNGLNFVATNVGDRYVLENMLENGYNLGGEQSGHVIFLDYNPTGDGILTSLMLVQILLEKKIKASEAAKIITIFPQVLINAKVPSDKKQAYKEDAEIMAMIDDIEKEFAGNGRVLIRPSGTEPLVRVMIEGENQEILNDRARALADLIEKKVNYNNNPVTKWCLLNTAVKRDENDNIRPDKSENKRARIDGAVSLIIAYAVLGENLNEYMNLQANHN